MGLYKVEKINITFSAEPLRKMNPKTLTDFGENFQWARYAILFTDKDGKWYSYRTPLYPDGRKKEPGQILNADSLGKVDKNSTPNIPVEQVEEEFKIFFSKHGKAPSDLQPDNIESYLNSSPSDKKAYSSVDFKRDFIDSERYLVLTKTNELIDPFYKNPPVGKKGIPEEKIEPKKPQEPTPQQEPKMSNIYRTAIKLAKEKEYFTGGFDIMKKLVKKQHKKQDIRKK